MAIEAKFMVQTLAAKFNRKFIGLRMRSGNNMIYGQTLRFCKRFGISFLTLGPPKANNLIYENIKSILAHEVGHGPYSH